MDIAAPLRPENLRPFASIVVPGLVSISPYSLLLGYYVTPVEVFWVEHPTAFTVLFSAAVLAAGLIVGELGERIEVHFWDALLKKANPSHDEEWCGYLRLRLDDEIVGQRFLRNKLTQFKFELAMVPALILFDSGMLWLQLTIGVWTAAGFTLFAASVLLLAGYLLFESWSTAQSLAQTRQQILASIIEGPRGLSSSPLV